MTTALNALVKFKEYCLRNRSLRLLSLSVAICIWSFTAISREVHYDLVLPVELRNTPPGYELASPPPGETRVTLVGPSLLIDGARRSNTAIILNLRGISSGKTLFSHLETNLKLPDGIRVTRVSPAIIEIDLRKRISNYTEGEPQQ
ncbi:MAG TPA: CdaR family protein [Desulfuromonadaceae bacterium]|jgi:hypothetical protein